MNSRQSAETYELKFLEKLSKNLTKTGENSRNVLSAPEISFTAPIRIESESK